MPNGLRQSDCCPHCWENNQAIELESERVGNYDEVFCPHCDYCVREEREIHFDNSHLE